MVEQRIIDSSELRAQTAKLLLFFVLAVWLMARSEFAGRIERKTRSGDWVRVWAITFSRFHVQHVCFMLIFVNVWQTTLHWIILLANNLMKWNIYEFPILEQRNEEINANKIIAFKTELSTFEGAYFSYTNRPSSRRKQVNPLTEIAFYLKSLSRVEFFGSEGFIEFMSRIFLRSPTS